MTGMAKGKSNFITILLTAVFFVTMVLTLRAQSGAEVVKDQTEEKAIVTSDPNLSAEEIKRFSLVPASNDPNRIFPSNWEAPNKTWLPHYHPQVNQKVFEVLSYPYYYKGRNYAVSDFSSLVPMVQVTPKKQNEVKGATDQEDVAEEDNKTNKTSPKPTGKSTVAALEFSDKGKNDDPNNLILKKPTRTELNELRITMEHCCDLVHQWRDLNEAFGTTVEIVRSLELSKISTKIYRINPKLAVQVRRTLGRIGSLNRQFDLTSRMAMNCLLNGQVNKTLASRMEKQLADIRSMLVHLEEQNDQIGTVLGVGAIAREPYSREPITYSDLQLPENDYFSREEVISSASEGVKKK